MTATLACVFVAAVTPMQPHLLVDLEAIPTWLDFHARTGCHGVLLLARTGTPCLTESIALTLQAFDPGADGAVVLPPDYFCKVGTEGLCAWLSELLRQAFRFPGMAGVPAAGAC